MTKNPDTPADVRLELARAKLGTAALGPHTEQIGQVEEGAGWGTALGIRTAYRTGSTELLRFDKGDSSVCGPSAAVPSFARASSSQTSAGVSGFFDLKKVREDLGEIGAAGWLATTK